MDEEIIFVKEVQGDKNIIKNNRRDDLERMYIFSEDAEFVGKSLANSIKQENVPQPDKGRLNEHFSS